MKTILVVAAHVDDEALGCGGTIARHAVNGDEVHVIFMADGVASRDQQNCNELQLRNEAAERAAAILGIKAIYHQNLPDNCMDSLPLLDIVQPLEKLINEIRPDTIYTHHIGDLNVDHRITHQAVMTVCRPQPDYFVSEIYVFEVMSSTEWQSPGAPPFTPNVFVDIGRYLDVKKAALSEYAQEMRKAPHSRSMDNLENLARYRGHSVGLTAAEAFMLIRKIDVNK